MNLETINRIKTNPIHQQIVKGSTPVVLFGNLEKSTVATLGINPSKHEFLKGRVEFADAQRRFETLNSLAAKELATLTSSQVDKVISSCLNYFKVNPYTRWFNQLENNILDRFSVSFYNDTACHLDIVQWATDPIWRHIDSFVRREMISSDVKFLKRQLELSKIEVLLVNGKSATELFVEFMSPGLIKHSKLEVGGKTCNVYQYTLQLANKKIDVFCWSNNLQSTRGLTNIMRTEIANWIKQ